MNASLHYIVRNLGRRRMRTVLGVLGTFLTVSLLTAIQIGLDSVAGSYTSFAALRAGKADLVVTAEGGQFLRPEPFAASEVAGKLAASAVLRGIAPRLHGVAQVATPAGQQIAVIVGIDPARERQLDLSGLQPAPLLPENSCAISQTLARKLEVRAGGALALRAAAGDAFTLKIESVLERQMLLPQEVKDYVVCNEATARAILREPALVHAVVGAFRDPGRYYDARDLNVSVQQLKRAGGAIAAELGPGFDVRLPQAQAIAAFQHFTSPIRAFFGVFAVLALSITALLVYSIVSVAVEERIREYAILRTLGGKRRDIVRLVLGESLLLCSAGVVPGVLAGVVLAKLGVALVARIVRAGAEPIVLQVSPATLWLALAAGLFLSVGSALLPALQAVRWRIVDALDPFRRGQIAPAPPAGEGAIRPLLFLGFALSALAVVVFFVLPNAFLSGDPSLIGTVVLCLLLTILLGFTLVALGALPAVERGLMAAIGWTLGPSAELAARNLGRHRRRNTTTALMFILSISWVVFIASLAALFSRTSLAMVEHFNGADLQLQSDGAPALAVRTALGRTDGVTAFSEVTWLRSRTRAGIAYDVMMSDLVGMKQLWVVPYGVDASLGDVLYLDRIRYEEGGADALTRLARHKESGPGEPPKPLAPKARGAVVMERERDPEPRVAVGPVAEAAETVLEAIAPIILSHSAARHLDVRSGDLVNLSFRLGSARTDRRFRVVAVCSAVPGFENFRSRVAHAVGSGVLLPMGSFRAMTQGAPEEALQTRFFVRTKGEAEQRKLAQNIRDDLDLRFRLGVKSTAERKSEAQNLYWVTQVLFGLLLGVAIVIAVFALIAAMATAVIERRWEIGVLKALGLRRGQLFKMFLGEAVVLTLSAGLVGGAIGFCLAYLFIVQAATLIEVPVAFALPYPAFCVTLVISLAAGAIAAHLPTRRLLRRPPAEILRMQE